MKRILDEDGNHIGWIETEEEQQENARIKVIGFVALAVIFALLYFLCGLFGAAGYWIGTSLFWGIALYIWFSRVWPGFWEKDYATFWKVLLFELLTIVVIGGALFLYFALADVLTSGALGYEMFMDKVVPYLFG